LGKVYFGQRRQQICFEMEAPTEKGQCLDPSDGKSHVMGISTPLQT